jgi:hypothetical protein
MKLVLFERPVLSRRFSLDQLANAVHHVETGQKIGNIVLTIGG